MKLLTRLLTLILLFSVPTGVLVGVMRKPKIQEPIRVNIREEYREQVLNEIRDPYSQFNRDELKYYSQASAKVEQIKKSQNIIPDVFIMKKNSKEILSNNISKEKKEPNSTLQEPTNINPTTQEDKEYTASSLPSTSEVVKQSMNKTKQGFWSSLKGFFTKKKEPNKEGIVDDGADKLYQDESVPNYSIPSKNDEGDLPKPNSNNEVTAQNNSTVQKPNVVELLSLGFLSDDILKLDQ